MCLSHSPTLPCLPLSQAFAGDTLHVGPGSGGLDHDIPHCLSRAVDESQTAQITQQYVDSCMRTEYSDMEGCIELG